METLCHNPRLRVVKRGKRHGESFLEAKKRLPVFSYSQLTRTSYREREERKTTGEEVYRTHQMEKEGSVRERSAHSMRRRTQECLISEITVKYLG
jgi:hypothetical protein